MRALDIIAVPSFHEAIPQSGLQALAIGVPLVASDVGGIPSIVRHGETGGLVRPEDAVGLATAIRESLEQKAQFQAMSHARRQFIMHHHRLDTMLDPLDAMCRQHLDDCCALC